MYARVFTVDDRSVPRWSRPLLFWSERDDSTQATAVWASRCSEPRVGLGAWPETACAVPPWACPQLWLALCKRHEVVRWAMGASAPHCEATSQRLLLLPWERTCSTCQNFVAPVISEPKRHLSKWASKILIHCTDTSGSCWIRQAYFFFFFFWRITLKCHLMPCSANLAEQTYVCIWLFKSVISSITRCAMCLPTIFSSSSPNCLSNLNIVLPCDQNKAFQTSCS